MAAAADNAELSRVAVRASGLAHQYGAVRALEEINFEVRVGDIVGVIGPDGVGKSTLLGLVAGARKIQEGRIDVLGCDLRRRARRRQVASSLAYMAEGLGANLYPELTVRENLIFFARLFGVPRIHAEAEINLLLNATGLSRAADRRVCQLSGGMKQKLALCSGLVHSPRLLVLDEPTTGVDPLSRRVFWDLISGLRSEQPDITVIVATAYMEEAEPFSDLLLLNRGRLLARGSAPSLCRETASSSLEEAYAVLLAEGGQTQAPDPSVRNPSSVGAAREDDRDTPKKESDHGSSIALEARSLSRRFGSVLAVDSVSFQVRFGEIFGFVGPNGCGKTTTLKMLTGILPSSEGEAWIFGERVSANSLKQRRRAGYMSQRFSLYGELTVAENLQLYGHLLDVPRRTLSRRSEELTQRFGLEELKDHRAAAIPLGVRQRLALAAALIHKPPILVLDEPTSGVDPLAREQFWRAIEQLAADDSVTVLVSTHYLTEASRCNRVALMNSGRVLACDAPEVLTREAGGTNLEDAFVAWIRADEQRANDSDRGASP